MKNHPELSIVLPCKNEEKALAFCLKKIKETIKENNLSAEIIVSDCSTDKSPQIAKKNGAILTKHNKEGYGAACIEGFKAAKGKYIFMADADATYDFSEIPNFLRELKNGNDLIIGNRFSGKLDKGAMKFLHKYFGTPALSFALRLIFGAKIKDSQSGMRAMKKKFLEKLDLRAAGMEFASEMLVKAVKNKLKIKEIPVNYHKRIGVSKLNPISDGLRHLKLMIVLKIKSLSGKHENSHFS